MRKIGFLLVLLTSFFNSIGQPIISSFSPASGVAGTAVTITGTGFNTTAANNIVFFGAVKATVSSASSTSLTATVPLGATYENITVLNTTTGLLGSSLRPFKMTFSGNISATSFDLTGVSFFVVTNPIPLAAADLDGDGKIDMIAGNSVSNSISIFRNKATSGVLDASSFAARIDKAVGGTPMGIAIGDLTGDGKPDIAVANSSSTSVHVFRNTSTIGSLSFAAAISLTTGSTPYDLVIADLNGDGLQDIAVANAGTTTVSVFKNTMSAGTLSFAAKSDFTVGSNPKGIAIGDIDGNGVPDIVVSNSGSTTISVLRNTTSAGSISFAAKVDKTAVSPAVDIDLGDLDGDGKLDIATANSSGTTGTTTTGASVFLNTSVSGSITLANKVDYSTYWSPRYIAIEDLNGDGKPDLTTNGGITNGASGQVSVLKNNSTSGSLSFATNIIWGSGTGAYGLAMADFDLDGRPDMSSVAFAGANGGKINLRRNNGDEPIITSFTPTSGPAGTTVTITGSKFTGSTAVSFGGTPASSFTVVSATSITAVVGSGTTGVVSITSPYGTRSSSTAFTLRYEISASIFAVGGGGGGGKSFGSNSHGGGGGSGGKISSLSGKLSTDSSLTVTVGAGGYGANLPNSGNAQTSGGTSFVVKGVATILSAAGGNPGVNAISNSGGTGGLTVNTPAAGAGGKGGTYATTNSVNGSIGSNSLSSWGAIVGYGQDVGGTYYFSGGGAGGSYSGQSTNAVGGNGGGGCTGAGCGSAYENSGTPNTGGGGGGANSDASSGTTLTGGNGGSGIVIIRYAGSRIATGGTITEGGGYTYHTFTSSGTLRIIVITTQPSSASQNLCQGATASSLSVVASGSSPSYQWYSNPTASNVDGTLIDGATSSSFTPPTSSDGTAYYYCMVTTSLGTDVSTVSGTITTISSVTGTIIGGGSVVAGTNNTVLTLSGYTGSIQWQSSSDNITFSDISSSTSPSYTATNLASTTYFIAVVTNGVCAAENSSPAIITMSSSITWVGGDGDWSLGSNWSTGLTPINAEDIIINSGNPKMDVDFTVEGSIILSSTGMLTINPGKTLSIASTGVVDFGYKSVTIKSDATGTAQLGQILGTLNYATNVTVERYIPATGRRYRMLTPSVNTTTSIKANWMEGNMNTSSTNANALPGFGTQITGPAGNANSFDASGSNAASLYLTANGVTPAYASITNTTDTLSALTGYFLFIRGDRSMSMSLSNTNVAPNPVQLPSSSTTLRATGTLVQGTVTSFTNTLSAASGGISLITNPYAAAIDWASVYAASTNINNYYSFWNPNLGFRGGFVTITDNGIVAPASMATTYIQSGQAFFITSNGGGTPTVSIQESHKVSGNNNIDIFMKNETLSEIASTKIKGKVTFLENEKALMIKNADLIPTLNISLYYTEASGYKRLTDGVVALFDDQYSAALDNNDAVEVANWDENISIMRNGKNLSIESRSQMTENDTLAISMSSMKVMNYELQFQGNNFDSPLLQPSLLDNYNNTFTPLSLTEPTLVPFTVTADLRTSSKDRFKVIFKSAVVLPFSITKLSATKKNESVQVDWQIKTDEDLKRFDVERSADGRTFVKLATVASLGKGIILANYSWIDNNPLMGANYYRIKVIPQVGKEKFSPVAIITMDQNKPSMEVYPNPAEGNDFHIKLSNVSKGIYQVVVTSANGQQVLSKTIEHPGGTAVQVMVFDTNISKGMYRVQVKGEGLSLLNSIIKN